MEDYNEREQRREEFYQKRTKIISDSIDIEDLVNSIESNLYLTNDQSDARLKESIRNGNLQSKLELMQEDDASGLVDISYKNSDLKRAHDHSQFLVEHDYIEGIISDGKYYPEEKYIGNNSTEIIDLVGSEYTLAVKKNKFKKKIVKGGALTLNLPGIVLCAIPGVCAGYLASKAMGPSNGTSGGLGLFMLGGMAFIGLGTIGAAALVGSVTSPVVGVGYAALASGFTYGVLHLNESPKLQEYHQMQKLNDEECDLRLKLNDILEGDYNAIK